MSTAPDRIAGEGEIRQLLAATLRGEAAPWPPRWTMEADGPAIVHAILFHGVAGLLVERLQFLVDWPAELLDLTRGQARAQAMWELRHRQLLSRLLAGLDDRGVPNLLLKGSAIAYDLYETPAARSRGDSDLLVPRASLGAARSVLDELGFRHHESHDGLEDDLARQEIWSFSSEDGGRHGLDLHWELLNAASLQAVLPIAECLSAPRPLPRLSPSAMTMDRPRFLLHTCVHRAMHRTAPYFVDGTAHFDEGRLIWSWDIGLLARVMDRDEWRRFARLAGDKGVAGLCLAGLEAAAGDVGAGVPAAILAQLQEASRGDLAYFRGTALQRAWQDLRAVRGSGAKLRYLRGRLVPTPAFIRSKYPGMARAPLLFLYGRRLADSLRRRGGG